MAVNPSANIQFLDGSLQAALNLATNTAIKLGVASGGPLLRPTLCTQASSMLQFFHGPLVASKRGMTRQMKRTQQVLALLRKQRDVVVATRAD